MKGVREVMSNATDFQEEMRRLRREGVVNTEECRGKGERCEEEEEQREESSVKKRRRENGSLTRGNI